MTKLQGLKYQKFDLHIHTPASQCFLDKTVTAEQIIQQAESVGLRAIAITDHNSGEWIDEIKKVAKNRGITVFPGVEVTAVGGERGIHVIGFFDVDFKKVEVENFLGSIGIKANQYGQKDAIATDIDNVIDEIYKCGGLAVLAHSNSSKGVLGDIKGASRKAILSNPNLSAVEVTEADFQKEQGKRAVDLLDGAHEEYANRKLAVYLASDNPSVLDSGEKAGHSIEGIASRYSYFKVDDTITIESLRQCFIDPAVRIRQRWEIEESAHQKNRYPYIKKLSVSGGFLDEVEVDLHAGLNTVIGAKGTGKSLFVEFLRFALDQESTQHQIKEDHDRKLEKKLEKYGQVSVVFVDETGEEQTLSRILNPLEDNPYVEDMVGDIPQLFPVIFLSQNEIVRIAEDENEQIKFIDKFFDFRYFKNKIQDIENQLEQIDSEFADGLRAMQESSQLEKQIKSTKELIERKNVGLKNPIFERFEQARKKFQAFAYQRDYLDDLLTVVQGFEPGLYEIALPEFEAKVVNDPAIKRVNDICSEARQIVSNKVTDIAGGVKLAIGKAQQEFRTYDAIFKNEKKAYEEAVQKSGGDYKALDTQRQKLIADLDALVKKYAVAKAKADKVRRTRETRDGLLAKLSSVYAAYSEERKKKCKDFETFSSGHVRVSVNELSDVKEFQERLLRLKKGSYLKDDEIEAIAEKISPNDFILNLLRYHTLDENKESYLIKIAELVGIDVDRMKSLANFLLDNFKYEELLALQYQAIPKDKPEIKIDIGGGQFELLAEVSTGQKCTAMLIMALCDGTMPVVVDQPEDSLDIRSIWDDMCQKLRRGKEYRQFIFTTHNSSLAVASDTDKYIVLEASASKGDVVYCGAIDTVAIKDQIINYLEGGVPTYNIKFKKYNMKNKLNS